MYVFTNTENVEHDKGIGVETCRGQDEEG